ncbi:universal stress protein [Actinoplanes solisilvae]|uniref:universal stress protein n=1 Tax=Actinoplanes solisilvae TaxID=2486853 RepID=UPI000FD7E732|nr:universal stress protein [Actinoplanes solisilvae]
MTNIDRSKAETEARRNIAGTGRPTPFGEAINRYLGAANHSDPYAATPGRGGARPAGQAVRKPVTTTTVLVGADDSPCSTIAVDHAAVEAEMHGWALRIVNVRRDGAEEAGERLLCRLADRVHACSPSIAVTGRLAIGSDPARALLAEAGDAGLVVVGHRHGGAAAMVGRSVAAHVVRLHPGPVLVVRMPGGPVGSDWAARPLVVGVDGSEAARAATDFAFAEARVRGCEVVLLHVVGDGTNLAQQLDARTSVPIHHKIISGDPVAALIEASGHAAAMVIGRYHHGMFIPGTALGAATHLLPQRAHCPVFLVGSPLTRDGSRPWIR